MILNEKEREYVKIVRNSKKLIGMLLVISIVVIICLFLINKICKEQSITSNDIDPKEYTWEQYQGMSPEEKVMFPDCFENMDEYNDWYEKNKPENEEKMSLPVIDLNGRKPEDYTWEEYQKMSAEERAVFPDYFENMDEFSNWYEKNKSENEEKMSLPVVDLNGRKPENYTWEEYQKMSAEEKAVFPDYFESMDAYVMWYNSVCE